LGQIKIINEKLTPKHTQLPTLLDQIRDKERAFQGIKNTNSSFDEKQSNFNDLNKKVDLYVTFITKLKYIGTKN